MKLFGKVGLEARRSRYAYVFLIPWLIGLIQFFVVPMFETFIYSFSYVDVTENGFVSEFQGLVNYKYALFEDPTYIDNLLSSFGEYLYSLPIVIFLSLVIAVMLNDKFKGRVFFRALYFIPVIVACGVVMKFFNGEQNAVMYQTSDLTGAGYNVSAVDFNEVLEKLNLPASVTELMSEYISKLFNLVWNCGVPITLFVSGLQTIQPQLYEAAKVEGANRWEEFWFITIPMLSNVTVLVIVYAALDLLTSESNPVIMQAYNAMRNQALYDTSAAMLWFYFAVAALITGIIVLFYNQLCVKRWQ